MVRRKSSEMLESICMAIPFMVRVAVNGVERIARFVRDDLEGFVTSEVTGAVATGNTVASGTAKETISGRT